MFSRTSRWLQKTALNIFLNRSRRRQTAFSSSDALEMRALLAFNGFGAFTEYDANGGPTTFIEVGDFNEDGHKDIVTPSLRDSASAGGNTTITVLYGNGTGTLSTNPNQTYLSLASIGQFSLSDLRVADINEDGNDDVLVAYGPALRAFLGNGNGTFSNPQTLVDLNASAQMFVLEDWNKDGHPDIAAGTPEPGQVTLDFTKLRVWLNNGNASGFTTTALLTVDSDTTSTMLAAGDMNGDGKSDLVWKDGASHVRVFPGNGNGTFGSSQLVAMEGIAVIRLRDINRDNKLDLVSPSPTEVGIRIRLNDGSGGFGASSLINMDAISADVEFSDIDNDGYGDLVSANPTDKSMSLAVGTGAGIFASAVSFSTGPNVAKSRPLDIKLVDLNEDGFLDAVLGNARGDVGDSSNTISVVLAKAGASISGTVFHDANNDSGLNIYDANLGFREPGLSGIQVHLDLNRDGIANGNDRILTTQSSGQYTLTGLAAGTYLIRFYHPDNSWTATTAASIEVTVSENEVRSGVNAGYIANPLPDLRLVRTQLTQNVIDLGAGSGITVSTTTRNAGTKPVPLVWNNFSLSHDAVLQPSIDLSLGSLGWLGNVAPNSDYDFEEHTWQLPSQKAAFWNQDGIYYIAVSVDKYGYVLESNEANNQNQGLGIDIVPFYALNTQGYSPQIRNAAVAREYTENALPVFLFDGTTLDDTDTAVLTGGRLTVHFDDTALGDVLSVVPQGTGPSQVGLSGNAVTYGGVVVGTMGFNGAELTIDFNGQATKSIVEAIVRRIGYSSTNENIPITQRRITTRITDGEGGLSIPISQTIVVTATNDLPVLANESNTSYVENDAAIVINPTITATDPDNAQLASATIQITNFMANQDVLSFVAQPGTMGNIVLSSNNSGVMTLTSDGATATLTEWQTALRAVKYSNTSNTPSTIPRVVAFAVNDGTGNSNTLTSTINIALAADTPSVSNAATLANTQTTSGLVIRRNAADGGEVTHFRISGITGGTLFQNNGTTPISDGVFITFAQANVGLKFRPTTNSLTTGHITVQASTSNGIAGLGGSSVVASITVASAPIGTAGNDAFVLTYSDTSAVGTVEITNSTDGGVRKSLGTFPMNQALTLMGLDGIDSLRIVGTVGNDTITVTSSTLAVNGASLLLNSIENRTLLGASGNDRYRFDADSALELFNIEESSGDSDTIDFSLTTTMSVSINLASTATQIVNVNLRIKLNSNLMIEDAIGGSAGDMLMGNALGNKLTGNAGDDQIIGAAGNDFLIGGLGNDTYVFGTATGTEADTATEVSGQGTDTLSFSGLTAAVTLNLGTSLIQTVHTNRTVKLSSSATFENITGGSGDDVLFGNSANNVLNGGAGRDIVVGNSGNDTLNGEAGRDVLIGGLGLDTINGGSDYDILIAGRTTNDTNVAGLIAIRTEWISAGTYASRIANLKSGVGSPVVSLKAKINVLNDASEKDVLTGGSETDWYFKAIDDVITDLFGVEVTDVL